jgi:hypothetical protein
MSNKNLIIDLKARKDVDGQTYYLGRIKAPIVIECKHGAAFLVFVADPGSEQLQIALMDSKENGDD